MTGRAIKTTLVLCGLLLVAASAWPQTEADKRAVHRFDGQWHSPVWQYGYTLEGGVGVATSSNSPKFQPGDVIIRIRATGPSSFAGQQVYRDGRWYKIEGILGKDDQLHIKGERNLSWSMERTGAGRGIPVGGAKPQKMTKSEALEQYRIIKEIALNRGQEVPADNAEDPSGDQGQATPEDEIADLSSCGTEIIQIGNEDVDELGILIMLATEVVRMSDELERLGYPRSVWGPFFDEWERRTIEDVVARSGKPKQGRWRDVDRVRLEARLATYQKAHPHLRKVTLENACGGHAIPVSVTFTTEPAGGAVFLIPVFFHKLCRAQKKVDPDDTARCDRWREAITEVPTSVMGDYQYLARWADGVVRSGRLNFIGNEDGQKIVLKAP